MDRVIILVGGKTCVCIPLGVRVSNLFVGVCES
jgi:hypothetical protein